MKVAAIQSNYIPWRGYFDIINSVDVFVFYDEVRFTKNDWRNRNRICSHNGTHWLTIPVPRDAVKLKIRDVRVDGKPWQNLHYRSLTNTYRSAPYFKTIEGLLEEGLLTRQWTHLADLNRFFISRISSMLGIKTKFVDLKDFVTPDGRTERLLSVLQQLGAREYLSGPAGRDYLEPAADRFKENKIKIIYHDYSGYPEYRQLHEPFDPFVSILDLLCHVPLKDASHYIWGWRSESRLLVNY